MYMFYQSLDDYVFNKSVFGEQNIRSISVIEDIYCQILDDYIFNESVLGE
jgi:hypothetical protein